MNVVLGVGGGIAAYKSAELARALMERGLRVQVVLTDAAQRFITPLTFAALTGRKVITESVRHGKLRRNAIQRHRAHRGGPGQRCNGDSAGYRGSAGPPGARPCGRFSNHDIPGLHRPSGAGSRHEQQHVGASGHAGKREILRKRGHLIVEPEEGILACGMTGPGRLAEPRSHRRCSGGVVLNSTWAEPPKDLEGETVLITAGPTQEPLDPVRFISNRSSGKMGYALAEAAAERGAHVILISGPVHLSAPQGVTLIRVRTAVEMRNAVIRTSGGSNHHRQSPPPWPIIICRACRSTK